MYLRMCGIVRSIAAIGYDEGGARTSAQRLPRIRLLLDGLLLDLWFQRREPEFRALTDRLLIAADLPGLPLSCGPASETNQD